ncbi:MAG: trypsin-like peptidase domain-containing protein [Bacteroidota bacterium]
MKKYALFSAIVAVLCVATTAYGQQFDRKKMEKTIHTAVEKAYSSSVRIWAYDSVTKQQNSAQFSGVVVSPEGHILTVAHTTVPGQLYQVFFPEGKTYLARALGRIGFKDQQNMPDVGMLKIIETGDWPYAEMGFSSSLKVNEPCIGISYPETLDQKLPTVRFGKITKTMIPEGFIESTSQMEPGDSGGPLYDYMGRVIALHSRIDNSEARNFEVPVDLYRKYWTALQKAEDYSALPVQQDEIPKDPLAEKLISIKELENLAGEFSSFDKQYGAAVVALESKVNGATKSAQGTLFSVSGARINGVAKKGNYLLAKSSIVGTEPMVLRQGSPGWKLRILSRDRENDLVLMEVENPRLLTGAIKIKSFEDTDTVTFQQLGKFLIAPLAGKRSKVGVLGSRNFSLPLKFSVGFFGAGANFQNEQIILTRMAPSSPAEAGKLQLGDQITGINGVAISRPEQYGGELMKYLPGDSISIQGVRAGSKFSFRVGLRGMPRPAEHTAELFEGGKSLKLDGFKQVFSHDAVIRPEECGGPVFDADGNFYGINIARFSRTSTLVMPKAVLYQFIAASI